MRWLIIGLIGQVGIASDDYWDDDFDPDKNCEKEKLISDLISNGQYHVRCASKVSGIQCLIKRKSSYCPRLFLPISPDWLEPLKSFKSFPIALVWPKRCKNFVQRLRRSLTNIVSKLSVNITKVPLSCHYQKCPTVKPF